MGVVTITTPTVHYYLENVLNGASHLGLRTASTIEIRELKSVGDLSSVRYSVDVRSRERPLRGS